MKRSLLPRGLSLLSVVAMAAFVAACSASGQMAEFWRPISEPNIQMSIEKAQAKLDFDISQCRCGIFPTNVPRNDQIEFQPDRQRMTQTSVTVTKDDNGGCMQRPSLVVAECMRARGWEVTKCSGRVPTAGGGALCAGYMLD